MNTIRKGTATVEIDFDKCLDALQKIEGTCSGYKDIERQLVMYNVLYLLQNNEFAIREQTISVFEELVLNHNFLKLKDSKVQQNLLATVQVNL
jgi:hypothetical protein